MNPTLEIGLAEIELRQVNRDPRLLDEVEKAKLSETSRKFWSIQLGRANAKGERTRTLSCLSKEGLLKELGATDEQREALQESELKLVCLQYTEEPDTRSLSVVATIPAEGDEDFTLEVPFFRFFASRKTQRPFEVPLELVSLDHGGYIPVRAYSPAHKDIQNIAEFFIPKQD